VVDGFLTRPGSFSERMETVGGLHCMVLWESCHNCGCMDRDARLVWIMYNMRAQRYSTAVLCEEREGVMYIIPVVSYIGGT
jgi:hypothetical protein